MVRDRRAGIKVGDGADGCGALSDWECFDLAYRGDEQAWRSLFRRHERRLTRIGAFITGSAEAARDITQETFIRVLRRKIPHRGGSLAAYLTTTAYRLALREKGRLGRNSGFDEEEHAAGGESPLETAVRSGGLRMLDGVLGSLPRDQREVIALRFYGGHSYGEIAGILGVPAGTVKSRIFYAIKNCRKEFRRRIPNEFPGRHDAS